MASAPTVQPLEETHNPAKSWKFVLVLVPILIVGGALYYKSQMANSAVRPAAVRPVSAADGRVHVTSPRAELDAENFDGNITWNAYPNAASYDVIMFRKPGLVEWKESTTADHITLHTEFFPPLLKHAIDVNATVGYSVIAKDAAGKVIADSGPVSFYVKVPPQPGFPN